eukprot:5774658-Pleurochrysis_carterae.AAC.2
MGSASGVCCAPDRKMREAGGEKRGEAGGQYGLKGGTGGRAGGSTGGSSGGGSGGSIGGGAGGIEGGIEGRNKAKGGSRDGASVLSPRPLSSESASAMAGEGWLGSGAGGGQCSWRRTWLHARGMVRVRAARCDGSVYHPYTTQ